MLKIRLYALAVLMLGGLVGWFVYTTHMAGAVSSFPFKLGLDLSGGSQLVYEADVSRLVPEDIENSMQALRDTIERRVNLFGVAEPLVQTERASSLAGNGGYRLVVELPGVTDTQAAIDALGATPVLEFRMQNDAQSEVEGQEISVNDLFDVATITGEHLERATLQFGQSQQGTLANEPMVVLTFNSEGAELFKKMTSENVGKIFGIFLDGQPISTPVIREAIPGGEAVISGGFTPVQARDLVQNLNFGALPVPITLASSATVGASLGADTLQKGITAGAYGFMAVMLFMIVYYRLPGVIAALALVLYVLIILALFKLIPVTLTAAGIAGFILSVGMAVDANVLVFERIKEELGLGKRTHDAVRDGFARAWPAIRDGHGTSFLSAAILFWFGTSLIQGFALVFGIGVLTSLVTAVTVSRTLLLAVGDYGSSRVVSILFGTNR